MQPESSLGLGDYIAAVKRRRFLMLLVAAPIMVIGIVLAAALPDVYRSTATFRLITDRVEEVGAVPLEFLDQYVFGLADKVLTTETLASTLAEVDPYPDSGEEGGAALRRLRSDIEVSMVKQTVLEERFGRERSTNVGFIVAYSNPRPDKAEQVASRLAEAFVETGRASQQQTANDRLAFFSGEVDRLGRQVAELERRMAQFKSANFDRLPEAAGATIAARSRLEQELDTVEREIRTLQQNRVFVAQQLRQAQSGPAAGNLRLLEDEYARKAAIYSENHPDLVSLRRQIDLLRQGGSVATGASLQAQLEQQRAALAEARQRYSDDHPDIRRMTRDIEGLEARISSGESGTAAASETLASMQFQTQLNAIDTQLGGLQARSGTLRSRLAQMETQLGATPEVEREYQEITRGLGSARDQLNQMIARRLDAEVNIAAIMDGAADRFALASAPGTPWAPSGPKRLGFVVASMALSVVFMFGAVVLAEMMDTSVRGARDIRSMLGITPLAVVPKIRTSVLRARRVRRLAAAAGALLVGTPLLYAIVHMLTN